MQNKFLIRFWFEFEGGDELFALGLKLGCGITAFSYEDAIYILKKEILTKQINALLLIFIWICRQKFDAS